MATAQPPELSVIEPLTGLRRLGLADLWRSREIVRALSVRDIKLRYRQTLLGAVWVVLQPVIGAGIFTFVFSTVASLQSPGVPYPLLAFSGMCAWIPFGWTLERAAPSLVHNSGLVTRLWFPRIVIPAGAVGSVVVDALVAVSFLVLISAMYGSLRWSVLLIPIPMALLAALGFGIGLITATIMVRWRDLRYVLPVGLQFLLWISPIGYDVGAVPTRFRALYLLNPIAPLIQLFRAAAVGTALPSTTSLVYASVLSAVVLGAGLVFFRSRQGTFADFI